MILVKERGHRFGIFRSGPMSPTDLVSLVSSTVAVLISLSSLSFSIYSILRDRARIRAYSKFFTASEYGNAHISVTVVNAGRRPVILRLIGGHDSSGRWSGEYLGTDRAGLRLGEQERYDHRVDKHELLQLPPDDDVFQYEDLWFEDSLGRRHFVKGAKRNIKLLMAT